ncbi:MAG: hypothetical protein E7069_13060 [Bacteroidales bacterium]|nr:hypothetical protein [Bacteroidales bacterium]
MNNKRRKQLKQAISLLEDAQKIIDDVCNEEEESSANLPDNLQSSDMADTMNENCESLQEVSSSIDDIIFTIQDLT